MTRTHTRRGTSDRETRRRYRLPVLAVAMLAATPLTLVAAPAPADPAGSTEDSSVAVTWQRIAQRTVYTQGLSAPPIGPLYLAFTSKAVHRAVGDSMDHPVSSEAAAIATAAHDVLAAYFPALRSNLDADLTATLADVADGPAERRGVRLGRMAAAEVVADRADDGRGDTSIVYDLAPGIGVWQAPATGMAFPWLGYVDPMVVRTLIPLDGPDPVGSAAYRADREEVRTVGRAGNPDTASQDTARFFGSIAAPLQFRTALLTHLDAEPLSLRQTTRLFAQSDAAMVDAIIQGWRAKREVGFWRPQEAITRDDGDPLTEEEPGWTSVLPSPAYADYVSGHGIITSAWIGVVRCHLGDDLDLTLVNGAFSPRSYGSLTEIEEQALESRIWAGLHFRDAMDDAYYLGHEIAARVVRGC